jgi:hypothetical protein
MKGETREEGPTGERAQKQVLNYGCSINRLGVKLSELRNGIKLALEPGEVQCRWLATPDTACQACLDGFFWPYLDIYGIVGS